MRIEEYRLVRRTIFDRGTPPDNEFWWSEEYRCGRFACPCGCGAECNILSWDNKDGSRYGWEVEFNGECFTVSPSILRRVDCKSHFFIRDNKVVWA